MGNEVSFKEPCNPFRKPVDGFLQKPLLPVIFKCSGQSWFKYCHSLVLWKTWRTTCSKQKNISLPLCKSPNPVIFPQSVFKCVFLVALATVTPKSPSPASPVNSPTSLSPFPPILHYSQSAFPTGDVRLLFAQTWSVAPYTTHQPRCWLLWVLQVRALMLWRASLLFSARRLQDPIHS